MEDEPLNGFTGFARKEKAQFQYSRDYELSTNREELGFESEELEGVSPTDARWAWVEVDLGAVRSNAMELRRRIPSGCRMMAVVKADAYGHGAVECAKVAIGAGADCLGVATVEEGVQLRKAGITAPVLVLSQPPAGSIPLLLGYRLMPAVFSAEFALDYGEIADAHNMKAPFHLALNTGMNRIGLRPEEVVEFLRQTSFHRALELVGTFTHFATADAVDTIDFNSQVRKFVDAIEAMKAAGANPGIVHAANSAALLRYPDVHFDMARTGILLYGLHPSEQTRGLADLQPAMSVKARITAVNAVPMSEGVGYGLTYRSPGSVKVCTVPLGYADGLSRALSNRWNFILDRQLVPQVGSICMDQCMFEVDLRSFGSRPRLDPQVGDEVTIVDAVPNSANGIDAMAQQLGALNYEVACGFALRLPHVYV